MVECAAEDRGQTFEVQARAGSFLVVLLAFLDHTGVGLSCGATKYGAGNFAIQSGRVSFVKSHLISQLPDKVSDAQPAAIKNTAKIMANITGDNEEGHLNSVD